MLKKWKWTKIILVVLTCLIPILFGIVIIFLSHTQENFELNESLDIPIYDHTQEGNDHGYNIGDLLNMPSVISVWDQNPHGSEGMYNIYKTASEQFPDSILAHYASLRSDESEPIPNFDKIEKAVDIYADKNKIRVDKNDDVLYIHLRSGDKGVVEDKFIEKINQVAENYKKVIVLTGIHSDQGYSKIDESKKNLMESLKKINGPNVELNLDKADNHIVLMRNCKNLMLHKGGFSTLGGIVFSGNHLYFTDLLECGKTEKFVKHLQKKQIHYTLL